MKKFFIFTSLILSFNSFAKDFEVMIVDKCKPKATYRAAEEYKRRMGNVMIDARAKEKSVMQNDILYHFIDVVEYDTGRSAQITVGVNPVTCAVKVVN